MWLQETWCHWVMVTACRGKANLIWITVYSLRDKVHLLPEYWPLQTTKNSFQLTPCCEYLVASIKVDWVWLRIVFAPDPICQQIVSTFADSVRGTDTISASDWLLGSHLVADFRLASVCIANQCMIMALSLALYQNGMPSANFWRTLFELVGRFQ